ncbi:hypothetical protein [Halomontanus rarus]|uniref:hypothetical protein n=1 Tax=Halomontanus rarus TaxID=3034020 RepID=UPI001A98F8C1
MNIIRLLAAIITNPFKSMATGTLIYMFVQIFFIMRGRVAPGSEWAGIMDSIYVSGMLSFALLSVAGTIAFWLLVVKTAQNPLGGR